MNFGPGLYEVINPVTIRRGPRVVEYKDPSSNRVVSNAAGRLNPGIRKEILSVMVDKDNAEWGRISEPDSAGMAHWICLRTTNRVFVKLLDATPETPTIESRIEKLESWARSKGYLD
jgi:hypothetical protein